MARSQVGARDRGKFSHSGFDCQFLNTPVTDHESAAVRRLDAERTERSDVDPRALGVPSDRTVVNPRRQAHDEVQSGSDALDLQLRQMPGERSDQAVSPPAVHASSAPDVAIVVAAGKELSEGELVESRREVVKKALGALHLIDEMRRNHEPAKAQCRRQCLRHRSDLHHMLGRHTLERTHRLPVVAELGVVVILDDQATVRTRPGDQAATPLAAQHVAGRELMRRCDEHSICVKAVDDHALGVDRLRYYFKAD